MRLRTSTAVLAGDKRVSREAGTGGWKEVLQVFSSASSQVGSVEL